MAMLLTETYSKSSCISINFNMLLCKFLVVTISIYIYIYIYTCVYNAFNFKFLCTHLLVVADL